MNSKVCVQLCLRSVNNRDLSAFNKVWCQQMKRTFQIKLLIQVLVINQIMTVRKDPYNVIIFSYFKMVLHTLFSK